MSVSPTFEEADSLDGLTSSMFLLIEQPLDLKVAD